MNRIPPANSVSHVMRTEIEVSTLLPEFVAVCQQALKFLRAVDGPGWDCRKKMESLLKRVRES